MKIIHGSLSGLLTEVKERGKADGVRVATTSNTIPDELGRGRFDQKSFRAEIEELSGAFEVLEEEADFVFGQAGRDGYCGFVAASALAPRLPTPTHRIAAIRTYAFDAPSIKSRALGPYSINSLVAVEVHDGRLAKVAGSGWMTADHLAPIGVFETDPVAVAERFLGAPYLWGGITPWGADCSGFVPEASSSFSNSSIAAAQSLERRRRSRLHA